MAKTSKTEFLLISWWGFQVLRNKTVSTLRLIEQKATGPSVLGLPGLRF